jgi:hypothetical protein
MRPYGPDVNGFKEGPTLIICQNQTLYNKSKMTTTMKHTKRNKVPKKRRKGEKNKHNSYQGMEKYINLTW